MNYFDGYKNTCTGCSGQIESARVELGLKVCIGCAKRGVSQSRYMGAMVFEHKTAGSLHIMAPDTYADFKAKTARKGQSSTLRNVLVGGGKLQ
jgi:reverse gyrase